MIERHGFRAMGTDVELLVDGDPNGMFEAVEAEFERLEQVMSRFRPDSELSRLNRESSLEASPDLLRVVELALDARERTGGLFDPTVHDALVAAGYDRTFDELERDAPGAAALPTACGGGVEVRDGEIALDEGVHLDLGGIGKGYAAERAAELLATAGSCLVNAGGDVAIRGGSWPIGVDTPDGVLTLALEGGGLATSGRDRRAWRRDGEERHHLIDPRAGVPSTSGLLRVTVVADDAVEAEVLAKTLFLGGAARAAETDAAAILVTASGETVRTGALR